jgi:lactaldehyde dehydrogenase/glycolaldehyde dehydrogenase
MKSFIKKINLGGNFMKEMIGKKGNIEYRRLYIDGEWVDPLSDKFIGVENPANEETFAYVSDANESDVDLALESSEKAEIQWKKVPMLKRCEYITRLCGLLDEKKEYFATLIAKEQGKTYLEAIGEVTDTIGYMQYAVEAARHIKGDILSTPNEGETLMITKVPYGVCLALCAWNYPLALIGRKLGPALVTGNTVIVKPHQLTPLATAEFFELVDKAGFPKGVVNLITTSSIEVSSYMVASPKTRLISITGSVGAGQGIYVAAAKNIAGLILELGGKAPFIVLNDADIDLAVDAAIVSRYSNCGQVCTCCDMIFAQEGIVEEFTEKLLKKVAEIKVGDPFDKNTKMGPKMCRPDLEKIEGIVNKSISEGAVLACGGKRPEGKEFEKGFWYEPTVLTGVTRDMTVAQKELFGPVLPIITIKDFDEAVDITNSSPYGLASYLFTKDISILAKAQQELEVGTIFMNQQINGYFHGFHSGHKLSGLNGEDGEYGIEAYMQKKTLYMNLSK